MAGVSPRCELPFGPSRPERRQAARDSRKLRASQNDRLRHLRASYDAAQTTTGNTNHWANSDALSPNAANSQSIRKTLRYRARYEVANNSYARGIVLTLANDLVGTGPKLQVMRRSSAFNTKVEKDFAAWAKEIGLAAKLRTMRQARAQDGETFALLTTNTSLRTRVKLDLRLIEPDRVTDPEAYWAQRNTADGIWFAEDGTPIKYRVLRDHPGDNYVDRSNAYDDYDAARVIHWFRADRPEQRRGLPDIMPALPLFAEMRRFTLATLAAAETAADFALTVQSKNATLDEDGSGVEAMDTVELEPRMATVLPEGYELGQMKAEHPATTYPEFKREILTEIARCLNIPYNIAAGDSSSYNYASGRLDHQMYFKSIAVERDDLDRVVLDRILFAFLQEYLGETSGIRPSDIDIRLTGYPHQWFWPGREHVDPAKEATAQATRLTSNTTTMLAEFARQGLDWEQELQQRAKEVALMRELGLSATPQPPAADNEEDEDEEGDAEQEDKTAATSRA